MEEKEIDIDNEEQILSECDFDYFYNLEKCSRELCMFYNDIIKQKNKFNTKQAIIDLGRIAITLNQQDKRIKELGEELDNAKRDYIPKLEFGLQRANKKGRDTEKENQQLKQQLHVLPKKIVGEVKKQICEDCFWEECEEQHCEFYFIIEYLNAILKKYGGGNE